MDEIISNQYGLKVVFLSRNEDYPYTYYLTRKRGYYLVKDNPLYIEYLGSSLPDISYLKQRLYL